MKTLTDIRKGVSDRAQGEEKRHIPKVAETEKGTKILITEAEVEVTKKTNKLLHVADSKRREINDLQAGFEQRKEKAQKDIQAIIEAAKSEAEAIIEEAETELEDASNLKQQVEGERRVLNHREQNLNNRKSELDTTQKTLEKRSQKITLDEDKVAKIMADAEEHRRVGGEIVTTLATLLQITVEQVSKLGRLTKATEFDVTELLGSLKVANDVLGQWEEKNKAKEEHLQREDEAIETKRRIIESRRKQLRTAERVTKRNV